jgi:HAD superfamily hydrolase (TIGR01509 family)
MYKLIIFDMDGTLVDTDLMLVESMLELFHKYRPDFKITLKELVSFSGPPLAKTIEQYFPGHNPQAIFNEFLQISPKYYHRHVTTFPGTEDVLKALTERKIHRGIVTNKMHNSTVDTLKMLNIDQYFEFIVGYDDVSSPKPHPEGINKCLKHFNIQPHEALYIGDTVYDYLAASAAKVDSAIITWALRKFDANIKPTLWFDDYRQLLEIIDG